MGHPSYLNGPPFLLEDFGDSAVAPLEASRFLAPGNASVSQTDPSRLKSWREGEAVASMFQGVQVNGDSGRYIQRESLKSRPHWIRKGKVVIQVEP
jgi:hypothetical protein